MLQPQAVVLMMARLEASLAVPAAWHVACYRSGGGQHSLTESSTRKARTYLQRAGTALTAVRAVRCSVLKAEAVVSMMVRVEASLAVPAAWHVACYRSGGGQHSLTESSTRKARTYLPLASRELAQPRR